MPISRSTILVGYVCLWSCLSSPIALKSDVRCSLETAGSLKDQTTFLQSHVHVRLEPIPSSPPVVDFSQENRTPCLLNELGTLAEPCGIEANSRDMVRKWLPTNATVLEVGARYGSVSCVIAAMQQQSGKVVSVEPDFKVWDALDSNLKTYACQVNVLKGVVGSTPVAIEELGGGGFGTRTHAAGSKSKTPARIVPAHSLAQVEKDFSMHFDTLVVDCEGCFPTVLRENPNILQQIRLIFVEAHKDRPEDSEEQAVADLQSKSGFKVVAQQGRQRVLKRVPQ
jgi:FkbM family methyltransferase